MFVFDIPEETNLARELRTIKEREKKLFSLISIGMNETFLEDDWFKYNHCFHNQEHEINHTKQKRKNEKLMRQKKWGRGHRGWNRPRRARRKKREDQNKYKQKKRIKVWDGSKSRIKCLTIGRKWIKHGSERAPSLTASSGIMRIGKIAVRNILKSTNTENLLKPNNNRREESTLQVDTITSVTSFIGLGPLDQVRVKEVKKIQFALKPARRVNNISRTHSCRQIKIKSRTKRAKSSKNRIHQKGSKHSKIVSRGAEQSKIRSKSCCQFKKGTKRPTQAIYEPPMYGTRITRIYEKKTGKRWHEMDMAERKQVNREIALELKGLALKKRHKQ